jgi:hypothetical protein
MKTSNMTNDELRQHFNVYKSAAEPHTFQIGSVLVMWQLGEACWESISISKELNTHWVRLGTVRNLAGAKIYQLNLGRLLVTWGSLK